MKEKKQAKPKLISVFVREKSTNTTIAVFPPTKAGERCAEKYRGLWDLEIIKEYNHGG